MEFLQKTFRNTVLLLTSLFVLTFAQNGQAQCSFNDLTWEVEDCVNGTFYVTFSFNNPFPSEDGFAVHKDFPSGYFVSHQFYGESSYSIGPFAGDGSTFYQFTLYDYSTNNCEGAISVGTVECDSSDECSLFASAQQSDCFEGGQFQWMIFVNPINSGMDNGYTIYNDANEQVYFSETYANNQNYGFVEAQSNGVGETVVLTVVDNANPDCQQTVNAVDLGCSLCEIEITAASVIDCVEEEVYYVQISVESENSVSGQFYVSASYNFATQYGPFNYGEETYTVGPFNLLGDENWVVATDAEEGQGSCTSSYTLGVIECPSTCNLEIDSYDMIVNPEEPCGEFGAVFNFISEANPSENVDIYADGEFIFSHPAQGIITVWPIQGDGVNPVSVTFVSSVVADCELTITIPVEEYCLETECLLAATIQGTTDCNDAGEYYVLASIDVENPEAATFIVSALGQTYGPFEYGQTLYEIGPIVGDFGDIYPMEFQDTEDPECSAIVEVEPPVCIVNCFLDITSLTTSECANGEFYATVSITAESNTLSVFDLTVGDWGLEGLSAFGQNTFNVGPISLNDTGIYQAYVSDPTNESCSDIFEFEVDCEELGNCTLDITSVTPTECTTGEFYVEVEITSENSSSDAFNLLIGANSFSPLPYGQGTYTVGPVPENNNGLYQLAVYEPSNDNCNDFFAFEVECTPICILEPSNFAPINCEDDEVYFIASIISEDTGSQGFTVLLNGEDYGTYEYETINYELGPFPYLADENYNFEFIDNEIGDACIGTYTFPAFDIENCLEICYVNLDALEVSDCNEDGEYFLNFEVSTTLNSPSTSFTAFIGSSEQEYGPFDYGQDVYTIGPLTPDGTINDFLIVQDASGVESCGAHELIFSDPECETNPECTIDISAFELYECDDAGQIYVDFEVTGLEAGDQFTAFGNGQEYGTFTYGETFYTVGPFAGNSSLYELIINNLSQENCTSFIGFETPNCETNTCQINIPFVEVGECNADGMFFVDFEMLPIDGDGTVEITGNGQNYGIYDYNLPLYTVGPFDGLETATYELIVTDTENPDCVQILSFASANCSVEECDMSLTFDEYANCFGDNQFYIIVSVTNGNVDEGSFTFVGNGETYGTEEYGAGSYAVGPFDGVAGAIYELIAIDNQDETCAVELVFESQECDLEPECNVEISFVENHECNEDAQYFVDFGLVGLDEGDEFFVFGNGEEYGTFVFGESFYTVGPFNGDGADYDLIIEILGQDGCIVDGFVQGQNCLDNFPCGFQNISAEFEECAPDGAHFYTIDFDPINVTNDLFNYTVNGNTNLYAYDALPLDIIIFPTDEETVIITICDNQDADCCEEILIELPECETDECSIDVTEYTLTDCDDEGNFYVIFSLEANNTNNDIFYAFHNGTNYGPFEFGQDSYEIGPFDGLETAVFEIDILIETNADCFAQIVFDSANCNGNEDCALDITEFEIIDCDPDNQFYVQFGVVANNPDAATFVATGNGENYGTFNYEDGFYIVGPFDGNLDPIWEIIVTDTENPDCSTFITFVGSGCEGEECNLDNIGAIELSPCNDEGQFYVDILMLAGSGGNGSFSVIGNGENYGTFEYGEDFYTVGPFNGDGESNYELIAIDNENENCVYVTEFDASDCGITPPCSMTPLEYELDCVDDEFFINLFFTSTGSIGETFSVFGNGTNYGEFSYENEGFGETVTLGPLAGDETEYEFVVIDTNDNDCSSVLELGQVNTADCTAGTGEICNLEVADYFTTECNNEGEYFVNIYLTENSFGSTFQVFYDSESYGPFEYGQEEYVVGPFMSGIDAFNLELFDAGFDQCFDDIQVEGVDCPISDCFIENLEVETGECNGANTYSVTINFIYNDVGGEFFNLIYQDEIIGTYETANLPITISNFDGNAEIETFTVCMTDLEDCCVSIDFLTPQCEGLVTWPGDGNFDGITNNMDILNMGVAYGFTGPERMVDNVSWDAQAALAWENTFLSGVNYVHADADGNGEVNMADSEVVGVNYDLTHDEVTPFVELEPSADSPELFVDMPDPFELQQGMQFNAPIIFGLEDLPVDNVYGLAFTLRYDPEIIDPASILLQYPISWLGFPQTNLMTFDYHDLDLGEIDVAITKIDQNNVSGWGEILNFIGIIDNIAGKTEIFIEVDNVKAILSNEERFAVNTPTEITTITSTDNVNELQGFELFPNPTNDIVRIKNETGLSLQSIQISDLNGKLLRTVQGEDSFDLSRLPSGVYMAKVVFEGKTVYRKVARM